MSGPAELLAAALRADPARPLLTHYDDATGERVELSVTTTDNWVAKTANLLQDDVSVAPGDRVALLLPVHWQAVVVSLACWSVGAVAVPLDPESVAAGGLDGIDVVAAEEAALPLALAAGPREVLGLSLAPLAGRLGAAPAGVLDYAAEVLGHGDRFAPLAPVAGADPALDLGGLVQSRDEVVTAARAAAHDLGLSAGDRVLVAVPLSTDAGLVAGLLAPLAAGAGIVTCRHLDPATLAHRVDVERVTALVGIDGPARRLDA